MHLNGSVGGNAQFYFNQLAHLKSPSLARLVLLLYITEVRRYRVYITFFLVVQCIHCFRTKPPGRHLEGCIQHGVTFMCLCFTEISKCCFSDSVSVLFKVGGS